MNLLKASDIAETHVLTASHSMSRSPLNMSFLYYPPDASPPIHRSQNSFFNPLSLHLSILNLQCGCYEAGL